MRDEGDVVELVRANPRQIEAVRRHLATAHADYVAAFDRLVERRGTSGTNDCTSFTR